MASTGSRTAAHYLARAKAIRDRAETVKDPEAKEDLLEVARQYEALASRLSDDTT